MMQFKNIGTTFRQNNKNNVQFRKRVSLQIHKNRNTKTKQQIIFNELMTELKNNYPSIY